MLRQQAKCNLFCRIWYLWMTVHNVFYKWPGLGLWVSTVYFAVIATITIQMRRYILCSTIWSVGEKTVKREGTVAVVYSVFMTPFSSWEVRKKSWKSHHSPGITSHSGSSLCALISMTSWQFFPPLERGLKEDEYGWGNTQSVSVQPTKLFVSFWEWVEFKTEVGVI